MTYKYGVQLNMYQNQLFQGKIYYEHISADSARDLLLLVHPLGMNRDVWQDVVSFFKAQYDILIIDLPGHGHSPNPHRDEAWDIPLLANMLQDLVKSLGYEKVHYVGTSIGGAIGQELLITAPEFIQSAVVTNTHSQIGEKNAWDLRAENVRTIGLSVMAKEIVPRWFGPNYFKEAPLSIAKWQEALESLGNEGYAQLCEALGNWSATDRLSSREKAIPVLCIAGSNDPAMPLENMQKLAQLMGNEELEVMTIGHVPSVEAPDSFNQILSAWLAKHTA